MKKLRKRSLLYLSCVLLIVVISLCAMNHSSLWQEASSHPSLSVRGVEIIGDSSLSCDSEYYLVSITNNSNYHLTGTFSIEKVIDDRWYSINDSLYGEFKHLLFQNKIDGLAIAPYSSDSIYLNLDELLPEKTPGNYRIVWTGFAKNMDQGIQVNRENGCLLLPFSLN